VKRKRPFFNNFFLPNSDKRPTHRKLRTAKQVKDFASLMETKKIYQGENKAYVFLTNFFPPELRETPYTQGVKSCKTGERFCFFDGN